MESFNWKVFPGKFFRKVFRKLFPKIEVEKFFLIVFLKSFFMKLFKENPEKFFGNIFLNFLRKVFLEKNTRTNLRKA